MAHGTDAFARYADSWKVHLRARQRSDGTIDLYLRRLARFAAWLEAEGAGARWAGGVQPHLLAAHGLA